MERSRLQKLEQLRELTAKYTEIATGLGIVEDPEARILVLEVLKAKVQEKRLQPEATGLPTIVAGIPCDRCGYAPFTIEGKMERPPGTVEMTKPRLRPPLRSDRLKEEAVTDSVGNSLGKREDYGGNDSDSEAQPSLLTGAAMRVFQLWKPGALGQRVLPHSGHLVWTMWRSRYDPRQLFTVLSGAVRAS
ncbi:hypothetical protein PV327_001635 [Microctonus hyperodae]|uniref:Uncharacterized protein n=1 Tax=Microctonus hyperodae TaxID=165561 RepID=A0AA39KNH2_MICHY|nr:hypothetical protein PV327_001635 [Microctonus hyperodae]